MMLQKTLIAFLLTLLIVQWTALPLLWQWKLADVRYEATSDWGKGELHSLTISRIEWEQSLTGKKEIRIAGNMYDIKSVQMEGDLVHLIAKRDFKEERLLKTGEQLTHQKSAGHLGGFTRMADTFFTVYLVPDPIRLDFLPLHLTCSAVISEPAIFTGRLPDCQERPPQDLA
jgi:hypothetical protein